MEAGFVCILDPPPIFQHKRPLHVRSKGSECLQDDLERVFSFSATLAGLRSTSSGAGEEVL